MARSEKHQLSEVDKSVKAERVQNWVFIIGWFVLILSFFIMLWWIVRPCMSSCAGC